MARIDFNLKKYEIRTPSFCECYFPINNEVTSFKGNIHEKVTCKCGEENYHRIDWTWEKDTAPTECFIDGCNVTFHPTFSQGTSIIRGNKLLKPNCIHYWEIRIITSMSGTDVMFGIGTDKVNMGEYNFEFMSALGINENSWGYSYRGIKQHNGISTVYGPKITQGCIVGIYLDLIKGYLEFYLNRKPLGIAFENIPTKNPNIKLYPMVCCTAAKSSIRLINATSHSESLQLHSMKVLSKQPMKIYQLEKIPGLRHLLRDYWFFYEQFEYSRSSKKNLPIEDEIVLLSSSKQMKKLKLNPEAEDVCPELESIYDSLAVPVPELSNGSDDEMQREEYFFLF